MTAERPADPRAEPSRLVTEALAFFEHPSSVHGLVQPIEGMLLLRHLEPTPLTASLYDPVVCLILQGRKVTGVGDRQVEISAGQALVVSHRLPVVSRITQAEPDAPYLAMIVTLELGVIRQLYEDVGDVRFEEADGHALVPCDADAPLVDVLSRYLALARDPVEARVLLPLVRREVHFRLLMGPGGAMLRHLLRHDSHASDVARAIGHLQANFRRPVSVPDLASRVGMSESALYKHFKAVTSTTPLQYLKELRLLEARRLLTDGALPVSTVAFEVGYESPNQFSREYSRKFGVPPRSDRGVVPS